jgi:hypothetical protein
MFIGHFAPAMVAAVHKEAPSLPVLMIAGQFVDWLFFGFLLAGVEQMRVSPGITVMNPMDLYHMPITHSLTGGIGWALLFGLVVALFNRQKAMKAALIAGAVVLSHWFLDVLVHAPDMTMNGGPPKLGLGLWNHPMIEMPLELAITFGALWFYGRKTGAASMPLLALGGVLLLLQAVNWFGPPPTQVDAGLSLLAFFAFGLATLVSWWVHRSRARSAL